MSECRSDVGRDGHPEREPGAQSVDGAQVPQKAEVGDTSRLVHDNHIGAALPCLLVSHGETSPFPLELRSDRSTGKGQLHGTHACGSRCVHVTQACEKISGTWLLRHRCVDGNHVPVCEVIPETSQTQLLTVKFPGNPAPHRCVRQGPWIGQVEVVGGADCAKTPGRLYAAEDGERHRAAGAGNPPASNTWQRAGRGDSQPPSYACIRGDGVQNEGSPRFRDIYRASGHRHKRVVGATPDVAGLLDCRSGVRQR